MQGRAAQRPGARRESDVSSAADRRPSGRREQRGDEALRRRPGARLWAAVGRWRIPVGAVAEGPKKEREGTGRMRGMVLEMLILEALRITIKWT